MNGELVDVFSVIIQRVAFLKKQICTEKKKNPQITIHAVQSPCPVGRGPLKE